MTYFKSDIIKYNYYIDFLIFLISWTLSQNIKYSLEL